MHMWCACQPKGYQVTLVVMYTLTVHSVPHVVSVMWSMSFVELVIASEIKVKRHVHVHM